MKNFLFICTALIALTFTTTVQADEGFYAGAFGGANWAKISKHDEGKLDFDVGYIVGGSLGYRWCNGLSLEAEVAYRRNKLDNFKLSGGESLGLSGHLRTWSAMANVLYELPLDFCLRPYVGAGVGYANQRLVVDEIDGDDIHFKGNENGFAYQLIGGVAYSLCDNIDVDLEYRYFRGKDHTTNNSVTLGMKYMF